MGTVSGDTPSFCTMMIIAKPLIRLLLSLLLVLLLPMLLRGTNRWTRSICLRKFFGKLFSAESRAAHSGTGGQPGNSASAVLPIYFKSSIPILLV